MGSCHLFSIGDFKGRLVVVQLLLHRCLLVGWLLGSFVCLAFSR